jgi:hypothetical protein
MHLSFAVSKLLGRGLSKPERGLVEHAEPRRLRRVLGGAAPEADVLPDLDRGPRRAEHDGLDAEAAAERDDQVEPVPESVSEDRPGGGRECGT